MGTGGEHEEVGWLPTISFSFLSNLNWDVERYVSFVDPFTPSEVLTRMTMSTIA
jgi:hypothetical protein